MDQWNPQNLTHEMQDGHDGSPAPILTTEESRQGVTTGHLRWILGVSVTLAVIAMVVVYAIYA